MSDRNFDDLTSRFAKKIYGGSKGAVRMAVIERDLGSLGLYERPPSRILEAGGGFGLMAQQFALLGSQADVVDISSNMLEHGQALWKEKQSNGTQHDVGEVHWHHQSIQETTGNYPFVCCHAVLEWVEQPESVLDDICDRVEKEGILSLMVFNEVALVWKNVLYGRVQKVLEDRLYGFGQSLTPKHAFTTTQIEHWLEQRGFEMFTLSGVRIFHDFLTPPVKEKLWSDPASFLELELKYSLNPMYLQMGRYLHFVCVKK